MAKNKKPRKGVHRSDGAPLSYTVVEQGASVLREFIRWSGAVAIAYLLFRAVSVLAGKTTLADIGINFLGSLRVSQAVGWIFGGGGIFYGLRQKKLKDDTIERFAPERRAAELQQDPRRTSSKLTKRGETAPDDRT